MGGRRLRGKSRRGGGLWGPGPPLQGKKKDNSGRTDQGGQNTRQGGNKKQPGGERSGARKPGKGNKAKKEKKKGAKDTTVLGGARSIKKKTLKNGRGPGWKKRNQGKGPSPTLSKIKPSVGWEVVGFPRVFVQADTNDKQAESKHKGGGGKNKPKGRISPQTISPSEDGHQRKARMGGGGGMKY